MKITILWSFSCYFFVKFHGKKIGILNMTADLRVGIKNKFSHFTTKTYVVGTQKIRLIPSQ